MHKIPITRTHTHPFNGRQQQTHHSSMQQSIGGTDSQMDGHRTIT